MCTTVFKNKTLMQTQLSLSPPKGNNFIFTKPGSIFATPYVANLVITCWLSNKYSALQV